ncbi:MAG: hypothetical protein ABL907_06060 [Hyphomicrobium sp.]
MRDEKFQAALAVDGKSPNLVLIVSVQGAFMHCAKSIARSNLWHKERWPNASDVASLAEGMVAHAKLSESQQAMQAIIDSDFATRMY